MAIFGLFKAILFGFQAWKSLPDVRIDHVLPLKVLKTQFKRFFVLTFFWEWPSSEKTWPSAKAQQPQDSDGFNKNIIVRPKLFKCLD